MIELNPKCNNHVVEQRPRELNYTNIKMPFGKFKGRTLDKLPNSYVLWLLNNNSFKDKLWMNEHLEERLKSGPYVLDKCEREEYYKKKWSQNL